MITLDWYSYSSEHTSKNACYLEYRCINDYQIACRKGGATSTRVNKVMQRNAELAMRFICDRGS